MTTALLRTWTIHSLPLLILLTSSLLCECESTGKQQGKRFNVTLHHLDHHGHLDQHLDRLDHLEHNIHHIHHDHYDHGSHHSRHSSKHTKEYHPYNDEPQLPLPTNPNNPNKPNNDWQSDQSHQSDQAHQSWQSFSHFDMHKFFNCKSHLKDAYTKLYTEDMWEYLEGKYWDLLQEEVEEVEAMEFQNRTTDESSCNSSFTPQSSLSFETSQTSQTFEVPYHAKIAPGKGRGAFASRDISKGEKVTPRSDIVIFRDGDQFRKYVMSLKRRYACDILEWAWIQEIDAPNNYKICCAFNNAVMMNSVSGVDGGDGGDGGNGEDGAIETIETHNIARKNELEPEYYAVRDIKKGQELLEDYGQYTTPWEKFGLGHRFGRLGEFGEFERRLSGLDELGEFGILEDEEDREDREGSEGSWLYVTEEEYYEGRWNEYREYEVWEEVEENERAHSFDGAIMTPWKRFGFQYHRNYPKYHRNYEMTPWDRDFEEYGGDRPMPSWENHVFHGTNHEMNGTQQIQKMLQEDHDNNLNSLEHLIHPEHDNVTTSWSNLYDLRCDARDAQGAMGDGSPLTSSWE